MRRKPLFLFCDGWIVPTPVGEVRRFFQPFDGAGEMKQYRIAGRSTHKHKKVKKLLSLPSRIDRIGYYYLLWRGSSETVSFLRPLALRAFNTLRPFAVDILSLNPCLFFLFLLDGWNVRFISIKFLFYLLLEFSDCKNSVFFISAKACAFFCSKSERGYYLFFFNSLSNPIQ